MAYLGASCIALSRVAFSCSDALGKPNASIILLNAAVSWSTNRNNSSLYCWPFAAQSLNSFQRLSQPFLCDDKLATIVANEAPSEPIYAEIEPPPGAGLSLAVSSANSVSVMPASLDEALSFSRYS